MKNILIVGAGPTGLTAAVELARRGIRCRIVDKKDKQSTLSRAVGINPRSLDILEACGVTAELLKQGYKMSRANFHMHGKIIGAMRPDMIPHRYNFLLALAQDKTEAVMHDRLAAYGGHVEYHTQLTGLTIKGAQAEVMLAHAGNTETALFDLVIAADGAHSFVRQAMQIPFPGYDYPNLWSITDFESRDLPYAPNAAHLFLHDDGQMGLVIRIGDNRWRGVSSTEEALPRIPGRYTVDKILTQNTFRISIRQAETYQKACVYLAGDAAHVHSPAGGRGMNLGIEDAWDLARRIAENDLAGYTAARRPVGEKAIAISELLVRMISIRSPLGKALRRSVFWLITTLPILQRPFMKRVAGLS